MRKIKYLFLSCLTLILCFSITACVRLKWKTPLDYGEGKWISEENAAIKIEMFVTDNRKAYSFVTYNDITKKYDNSFISEKVYFRNIDEEGNLILNDGHITGFSADIVDGSEGTVTCKMDLNKFINDFLGSDAIEHEETYSFVLKLCIEE